MLASRNTHPLTLTWVSPSFTNSHTGVGDGFPALKSPLWLDVWEVGGYLDGGGKGWALGVIERELRR